MRVTKGSLAGQQGRVVRDIIKGPVIQVSGRTYVLASGIAEVHLLSKEESRSVFRMILILLLGVTFIGLIIAIPMLIGSKTVDAQVAIKTNDGTAFVASVDRDEWKLLSRFRTANLPEGFKVS
jgi:hypothetical protein